jgi:hypothetical protein
VLGAHPAPEATTVYPGPQDPSGGHPAPVAGDGAPASPGQNPDGQSGAVAVVKRLSPPSAFAAVRARWMIVFVVVGLIGAVIVGLVAGAVANIDLFDSDLFAAVFYLPLVVWALFVQWHNKVSLRLLFAAPRIGGYWGVVAGMTVVLMVFSLGASVVTSALFPDFTSSADIDTGGNVAALVLTIAVLPPFIEELIFRGLLLERWAAKWRIGTAVAVQAVLFGILHVDPVGAAVFGVVMALMYLRTKTLWVPIAMHAANNALVLVAVLFAGDAANETAVPANAGEAAVQVLAGLLVMAAASPVLVVFIRRNWPGPDQLTPYEEGELGEGALPPRRLGAVSVAGRQMRAAVLPEGVLVSLDRAGRSPQWAVPYHEVTCQAVTPDWRHMLLMGPGGQLQLDFPQSGERSRTRAMHTVAERVQAGSGTPAEWWR